MDAFMIDEDAQRDAQLRTYLREDKPRKLGWDDRDVPLDDAVCEITWQDGVPWVRLCFRLEGVSYEIEQDQLPDKIRDTLRALA